MIQCVLSRKSKLSEICRQAFAWHHLGMAILLDFITGLSSSEMLQVVLKRLMYAVVKQLTHSPSASNKCTPRALTDREENAMRYMARYIIVKLRKKYRKHSVYARALETMKTSLDETNIESLHDYTRVWVEQRDRGLCHMHVSDDLFALIKRIEMICRLFLDTGSQTTTTDSIIVKIEQQSLQTKSITALWNDMVPSIPPAERADLLRLLVKLWMTIRVHSFAEGWTDKFQKSHKKNS